MHQKLTKLKPKYVEKAWGHEEIIVSKEEYCGKILHIKKGGKLSQHAHRDKIETFRILSGYVKVTGIDTTNTKPYEVFLQKGEILDIPQLCFHQVEALEETDIIEFSSKDTPADNIKIFPGDSQT